MHYKSTTSITQELGAFQLAGVLALISDSSADFKKTTLVVVKDSYSAKNFKEELEFFLPAKRLTSNQVLIFPSLEIVPYENWSPDKNAIFERLRVIERLLAGKVGVLIVDVPTLMYRLPPRSYLENRLLLIELKEVIERTKLKDDLIRRGYVLVNQVMEQGEFAIRGEVMDIFPMNAGLPYRLGFWGDEVESIYSFDPISQLILSEIKKLEVLPAEELPSPAEAADTIFCNLQRCLIGEESGEEITKGGVSTKEFFSKILSLMKFSNNYNYLPLFFESLATLFDFLPKNYWLVKTFEVDLAIDNFWQDLNYRYEQLRYDKERPILAPESIFVPPNELIKLLASNTDCRTIKTNKVVSSPFRTLAITSPGLRDFLQADSVKKLMMLKRLMMSEVNLRVLLVAGSLGHQELLKQQASNNGINLETVDSWQDFLGKNNQLATVVAKLSSPVLLGNDNFKVLIVDCNYLAELKKAKLSGKDHRQSHSSELFKAVLNDNQFLKLMVGDFLVHREYGIGRYLGIEELAVAKDQAAEFLVLEYANQAKVYVPVSSFNLISRYESLANETIALSQLGSGRWEQIKKSVKKQIHDVAAELLKIQASRHEKSKKPILVDQNEYQKFVAGFNFETTIDQQRTIEEVVLDLSSSKLMDRLVCGDTGFGKTEVALRATFVVASHGKQVAVLVPTTLLAKQHYDNFLARFALWPFRVALLSGFLSTKEQQATVDDLLSGKIDILIGTHSLLSKRLKFKSLGLLIIDEEHRFGVRQKEHIKQLTAEVDVLSLTATPIPRTLNLALTEIRDLSIIATPPERRLPIKTMLREYQPELIKEAIFREVLRGGQVYLVHNDIKTIDYLADLVRELIKEHGMIELEVAHGEMPKAKLEQIMHDFYHLKIKVLVCTTIIESGLDVPSANTIIINRADRLGLAQLYQLRGRIGRADRQGYAYLLVPNKEQLAKDALSRLLAIEGIKGLGGGFAVAHSDLEIRGAGELLGDKQSGLIRGVGFSLYLELLTEAINLFKKREEKFLEDESEVELELGVVALIPSKYLVDVGARLNFYKQIADAQSQEELDELAVEMVNRYGPLPQELKNLFKLARLKLDAKVVGIEKFSLIVSGKNYFKGIVYFKKTSKVKLEELVKGLREHTTTFKFVGPQAVEFLSNDKLGKLELTEKIISSV